MQWPYAWPFWPGPGPITLFTRWSYSWSLWFCHLAFPQLFPPDNRPSPRLPLELLIQIVEQLEDLPDERTLEACSLASSLLRDTAQRKLYSHLRLRPPKLARICECLRTRPSFIPWVQALTIPGWNFLTEADMALLMDTIATLAFDGQLAANLDDRTSIRSHQVRVLHVWRLTLPSWLDLERIILAFPMLDDFKAVDVKFTRKRDGAGNPHLSSVIRPTLTRCCVYGADEVEILDRLFPPTANVRLRFLELHAYTSVGTTLIRRAGSHLKELVFESIPMSRHDLDLSPNRALSELTLNSVTLGRWDSSLVGILDAIVAPTVQKITLRDIRVEHDFFLSVRGLGSAQRSLDGHLADKNRFPRLQMVDFWASAGIMFEGVIGLDAESWLPTLTQRDMVYIRGRRLDEWRVADLARGPASAMRFMQSMRTRNESSRARLE